MVCRLPILQWRPGRMEILPLDFSVPAAVDSKEMLLFLGEFSLSLSVSSSGFGATC